MKLSTSLVAVKKINSTVDRSKFSDDELERTAKLILEAEGIINPLILRRTSLESYEVVDGDFEYYAAAKAREKDPRKGEMIGAFIIEPENEEVLKEQVEVLRKQGSIENDTKPSLENLSQDKLESLNYKFEKLGEFVKKIDILDNKQTTTQEKLELLSYKVEQVSEVVKRVEDFLRKHIETQLEKNTMPEPPVDKMTVSQLRAKAKERNIKGYSKMKRNDLIAELKSKGDAI
jgi:ParB family chromosome partitioning protein